MKKTIVLLVLLLAIGGCSAKGPRYSPVSMENGKGQVYIYRPASIFSGGNASWVVIDGERRSALRNNGYHVYDLPSGNHSLKVGRHEVFLSLDAGETKYVRYRYGWYLFHAIPMDPGQLKEVEDNEQTKTEIAETKLSM